MHSSESLDTFVPNDSFLSLSLSSSGEHKLRTLVGGPTWNSLRNGWFGLNFLGNDRHSVLSRRSLSSNVKEQRKSLNYHFLFCARNAHSERLLLDELMEAKEINGERDKLHAFLFQKWSSLSLSLSFHKVSKFLRFNIFLPLSFPSLLQTYSVPTAIFCPQKQRNNVSTNCTGFFPRDNSLPSISCFFVPTHFCL